MARSTLYAVILTLLVAPAICIDNTSATLNPRGHIIYFYDVDRDGNTSITITVLYTGLTRGSSWVVVPAYTDWMYEVSEGSLSYTEVKTIVRDGSEDPFWKNFTFTFTSELRFLNLTISYVVPLYTFILEPNGLFYSSQIEYKSDLEGIAEVLLPEDSFVSSEGVKLITGSEVSTPSDLVIMPSPGKRVMVRCSTEPNCRIMIPFTLRNALLVEENYTLGVFTFYTAPRYASYAKSFLKLYNRSLPIYEDIFGVRVKSINVTFFLPSPEQLLGGLGGYVPFSGKKPGDIHLNIFYLRTMSGFLEIIALHELTHQMLWYAGIGPSRLWVHEGMAEYFSLEIGDILSYKKAVEAHRRDLEMVLSTIGENYGFVQRWSIGSTPSNVIAYYAAAYKIFKTVGDRYGGLEYYKKFFKIVKDIRNKNDNNVIDDDTSIITALGMAAGNISEVLQMFKKWNFSGVRSIEEVIAILERARKVVEELSLLLQPFKLISEFLLSIAWEAYNMGRYSKALFYASSSITVAENALLLSLITYGGLTILVFKLVSKRLKPKPLRPVIIFCPYCGSRPPEDALFCPYCGYSLKLLKART